MIPRHRSGEIVNATLLEVFLSFIFVVLTLAWLTASRYDHLRHDYNVAAAKASACQQQARQTEARRASQPLDSPPAPLQPHASDASPASPGLAFNSQFPPYCPLEPGLRYFLVITLLRNDELLVAVHHSLLQHHAETTQILGLDTFVRRYHDVASYGRQHNCRYLVLIRDTDDVTKHAFKRSVAQIKRLFYTTGETR